MTKVMNNIISKSKVGAVVLGLTLALGLTSCNDLFEPAIENHLGFEYMYDHILIMQMVYSEMPIPVCLTVLILSQKWLRMML